MYAFQAFQKRIRFELPFRLYIIGIKKIAENVWTSDWPAKLALPCFGLFRKEGLK